MLKATCRAFRSSVPRRAIRSMDKAMVENIDSMKNHAQEDYLSGLYNTRKGQHVVVFKPALNATQNALPHDGMWRLYFDSEVKTISPLNGWAWTTATTISPLVGFASAEDAAKFATNQGFTYTIVPDQTPTQKKKSYNDNFRWRGHPKEEEKF